MKILKRFLVISGLISLSTICIGSGYQGNHSSVMAAPVYAQRIVLSDASAGKVLLYWNPRNLECNTCITKTFNTQARDFYLKYLLPRETETGKIFATFRIMPQCYYDIQLTFSIDTWGQFILPTNTYPSTPDSRNASNCASAPAMNVLNGKDVTYISWA